MTESSDKKVFVTREHIIPDAIQQLRKLFDVEVWRERSAPPREVMLRKAAECDGMLTEVTELID